MANRDMYRTKMKVFLSIETKTKMRYMYKDQTINLTKKKYIYICFITEIQSNARGLNE